MSEGLNRFFMRWLCSMRLGIAPLTKSVIAAVTISYSLLASSHAAAPAASANAAGQTDWCKRLTPRLPSVSTKTCQSSALTPTGAVSRKGFPILVRDVLPDSKEVAKGGKGSNNEPVRVLLLGGIHGDELTSSAIVFRWLGLMQNPTARSFHWRVAPVVNPDGLLAPTAQRVNANGVDLNRNFPMPDWSHQVPPYWTKVTGRDPRRFPGSGPLSEPETQWVNEEIARFRPNVIISIHAPFGLLDFDGPATPPRRFGRLLLNPIGVYPGSLGNYSGLHMKVPVITIELPHALEMPPDAEVKRIWLDMLTWIKHNGSKPVTVASEFKSTLVPTRMDR